MTRSVLFPLAAVLLIGGLVVLGCGKKTVQSEPAADDEVKPAVAKTAPAPSQAEPAPPVARMPVGKPVVVVKRDALHQSMETATRDADNPPADANRPPDETVSKKLVHKILADVRRNWDTIRFTTRDGKKILYTADIETSQGTIQIALFPELSPNHVRNFIALARAGYYDQLFFDRVIEDKEGDVKFESIEAGCPEGSGETVAGSIGYWLKDELTPGTKMSHEEGTVGACRTKEEDSAACRFYITLTKAPLLDGHDTIFGKVTRGLDVARTIFKQPCKERGPNGAKPENPVVIQKVTITEVVTESKR